jgi:signal transduction histidine kinase/ActR/RegA family two-component response regulator
MNLREANELDFCEADRSLRQFLTRSRGDSSIATELWIERFLNRLATGFNHGLSQAIPILEASLWQRLADELSQALGDTIAIALPTPDPNQFEVQHSAFVSNPVSYLGSGRVITQSKLEHLQAQSWQSAWRIDDTSNSIAWLIAVPLSLTIAGEFEEAYFVQLRSTLVRRAITQAVQAVRQARSMQQLQQQCQQLSDRNRELTQTSQLKNEFLANTSHEIRTPLTSILGFTHLLREQGYDFDSVRHHEYLKIILSSGQHLLALINDILDLSKIEANQLDLQQEAIDVPQLCQMVLKLVQEKANDKGLSLRLAIPEPLPMLIADPLRLKQMLFNLLSNALKFTAHGSVGLDVRALNHEIQFAVWDTGKGISHEQQSLLFKPYAQLPNVEGEGTGLGLFLTQKLVEMHGGWVTMQSESNQGSRFTIGLPVLEEATKELFVTDPIAPSPPISNATTLAKQTFSLPVPPLEKKHLLKASRPCNILLVEDNAHNARLMITCLCKLGYEVTWAKDSAEMWHSLKQPFPALILMDIHLPGADGLTLTRQLQANDQYRQIPVIVQTAMAMKGDRERCLEAGAIDYLSKPIDLATLAHMVAKYSDPGN